MVGNLTPLNRILTLALKGIRRGGYQFLYPPWLKSLKSHPDAYFEENEREANALYCLPNILPRSKPNIQAGFALSKKPNM